MVYHGSVGGSSKGGEEGSEPSIRLCAKKINGKFLATDFLGRIKKYLTNRRISME
jgi:hypothetical protein